ncbi:hypothetical protein FAM4067_00017 [Lacticaseibacillus paracasei]|nr:hypothetical protein [Lacticaseibacillus paracasei]RND41417.1 hypothetical protein FAM10859_00017 [Lacticaseibacillus paracasei]RNE04441.1 hypothetical protein FAM22276_00017 [Lacticaseibacillus paracasei]RNE23708.1 hypothetical protein FAM3248_00455 [Lacticaseibacillus paracasei]RNE24639.1 hypothetical protein FAM4067_00017 [Lacticaseibacillus paracasei]
MISTQPHDVALLEISQNWGQALAKNISPSIAKYIFKSPTKTAPSELIKSPDYDDWDSYQSLNRTGYPVNAGYFLPRNEKKEHPLARMFQFNFSH